MQTNKTPGAALPAALDDHIAEIVTALLRDGFTDDVNTALDAANECAFYTGCATIAEAVERFGEGCYIATKCGIVEIIA